jgi:DNA-binding transcriptional LysR family regulator
LRLSQSGASAYLAALVDGTLDLALVSVPDRFPPQLDTTLLFAEPMVFVCPADHRLARRKRLDVADAAVDDIVKFPPEFGLWLPRSWRRPSAGRPASNALRCVMSPLMSGAPRISQRMHMMHIGPTERPVTAEWLGAFAFRAAPPRMDE